MYTWRPTSVLRCKTANDVDLCLFSGTEKDIYQLSLWQIMAKRIAASKAIDQEEAPAAFWHQNDWHLNLTNISRDQVNPQGVRKLPGHQAAFFRCYRPHKEWACRGSFRAWSNRSWNKSFFFSTSKLNPATLLEFLIREEEDLSCGNCFLKSVS